MRSDSLPRTAPLLFSANSDLIAVQTDFDFIRLHSGKFDAKTNLVAGFADVNGRDERAGEWRGFHFGSFIQRRVQPADAFGELLQLDPFESGGAHALHHGSLACCH